MGILGDLQNHGSQNEDIILLMEEIRRSPTRVSIITASPMLPPESAYSWDPRTFQPFPVAAQGVVKVQASKRRLLGIASQFECEKKTGHVKNFVYKEYIASDDLILLTMILTSSEMCFAFGEL